MGWDGMGWDGMGWDGMNMEDSNQGENKCRNLREGPWLSMVILTRLSWRVKQ